MRCTLLCVSGFVIAAGCAAVTVDPDETDQTTLSGPTVEFDPGGGIIPFPNNLLIDPATGRVNLPATPCETPTAAALRTNVLNQLDGFGTYEVAITATFTQPVDPASLTNHVLLFETTTGTLVPNVIMPTTTARFAADACDVPIPVNTVAIVPTVPLPERSTFTAVLLAGITTPTGEPFQPSATWALLAQPVNPVTVVDGQIVAERTPLNPALPDEAAQILALAQLWDSQQVLFAGLDAKGIPRDQVLLAWQFTTQTTTDTLDPRVAGTPAADVTSAPVPVNGLPIAAQSITCDFDATTCPRGIRRGAAPFSACPASDSNVQCFLKISLGTAAAPAGSTPAVIYATGNTVCATIGCAAVGDVVGGLINAKNFQTPQPNAFEPDAPLPGPWSDPYHPRQVSTQQLQVLAFIPATPPPGAGYPVVVFGHGLGASKESAFAIAPQLASQGFMTVGIDFVLHGSRAVRTAADMTASFLSPDLASTRDSIRQSVLDVLTLITDLKACATSRCDVAVPGFRVDTGSIEYLGQSLGGIIGSVTVAVSPDIQASVLNVAGVGWVDIFENTQTLQIRCPLINGLITAGIVTGDLWTGGSTGLCLTDAFKTQPGYQQFAAVARWVLDPADPANFTPMLARKLFLLQEVVGDQVVPNITTEREAALTGTPGVAAACGPAIPPAMPPSPAIVASPSTKKFLRYMDLPAGTCDGRAFPGNTFAHASLLQPERNSPAGQLGTARLQTDAITYLLLNQ
jgi:platelet-activating factor acetylhydrolase isoform II